mmetsp:Transcript_15655/g.27997  ORF Transcript_15655/g.27997 Transcript_15655/m.27997 type:complete len:88 (+) Transcript_15655:173-436(+)
MWKLDFSSVDSLSYDDLLEQNLPSGTTPFGQGMRSFHCLSGKKPSSTILAMLVCHHSNTVLMPTDMHRARVTMSDRSTASKSMVHEG